MDHWYDSSIERIDSLYHSIKQAQPTLSDETILRLISLNYYPFGERAMHPYKMWLKAMRDYRHKLAGRSGELKIEGPLFERVEK